MKSKEQKRSEAITRNAVYSGLTLEEKVAKLGFHKAAKQRKQFKAAIEARGVKA